MSARVRITSEIKALYAKLKSDKVDPKLVKIVNITLYHGTSQQNGVEIVREQYMEKSDDKCLFGEGYYFYEEVGNQRVRAIEMARAHARLRKGYPTQAVVEATVSAGGIFDLTLPENNRYFQFVFDWCVNTVSGRDESVDDVDVPFVVRFILLTCPERDLIQGVRWDGFWMKEIRAHSQYGFLIRDWKCIKELRLHGDH